MLLHHGLFSPATGDGGPSRCRPFVPGSGAAFAGLLLHRAPKTTIRWIGEVWPFQWRIAVSWMCGYFTVQVFIPIIFALRGAVEAGQMGMSISITSYMTALALAWSSTKSTPFGAMIARGEFHGLDRLFRRTLIQSLAAFAFIALGACGVASLLPAVAPRLAVRMVSPRLFAALALAAGAKPSEPTEVFQKLFEIIPHWETPPTLWPCFGLWQRFH